MPVSKMSPLSSQITWDFTTIEQGNVSRYGRMGEQFYKQYLPGGIEVHVLHPPRQINQRHYSLAKTKASSG